MLVLRHSYNVPIISLLRPSVAYYGI